ncbi:MAG: peptide-methionine (S)-S-oxide reductase MsrA [Acaryochloridaceae cyanobacterium CSU_3_4]|nr:peptide-methionine (S)-S-oxide reductase MsrA [Acaryochloris sp. SU_5_25]NJN38923.1 peptide-methionine (S)-S-oxide reductase MsrA [Acaryochloridaceae cyanobacterium CSU_3_4]
MSIHRFVRFPRLFGSVSILVLAAAVVNGVFRIPTSVATRAVSDPVIDIPIAKAKGEQTAVLAGGCFWGMEAIFEHLKGVSNVVSGFSGGNAETANYDAVGSGQTGHAESIKITYDPSQISYGQLLKIYFAVAHDPTQLNRQGPDAGHQYRSAIFFANAQQRRVAQAYIAQLNTAKTFNKPIVTQLLPLDIFYAAEEYHQNFIDRNPQDPYVVVHDLPKLRQFQKQFPDWYRN